MGHTEKIMRPMIHTHIDIRVVPLWVSRSHALKNMAILISDDYEKQE